MNIMVNFKQLAEQYKGSCWIRCFLFGWIIRKTTSLEATSPA